MHATGTPSGDSACGSACVRHWAPLAGTQIALSLSEQVLARAFGALLVVVAVLIVVRGRRRTAGVSGS